jgi:putative FmdB family regulatory protein
MPLYEYQCDACGHRFEVIQRFADSPLAECPTCGGTVRKLQSAPAFQLKGTGWYVTDYPKSSQTPGETGPGGDPAGTSSEAEGATKDKIKSGDKADKAETKTNSADKGEKVAKGASSKEAAPPPATAGPKAP